MTMEAKREARCPAHYGLHQCKLVDGHADLHWTAGGNLEWRDGEGPLKPSSPEPSEEEFYIQAFELRDALMGNSAERTAAIRRVIELLRIEAAYKRGGGK